jgi:hypothetical protein
MKRNLVNRLDELWSKIVKDLAGWTCEYCEIRGVRMEAAHVAGRRYRGTRWGCYIAHPLPGRPGESISIDVYDLCGHCLCHNCHQQYDDHGPLEDKIVQKVIGVERKLRIQALALPAAKGQVYEEIEKTLEEQCGKLK